MRSRWPEYWRARRNTRRKGWIGGVGGGGGLTLSGLSLRLFYNVPLLEAFYLIKIFEGGLLTGDGCWACPVQLNISLLVLLWIVCVCVGGVTDNFCTPWSPRDQFWPSCRVFCKGHMISNRHSTGSPAWPFFSRLLFFLCWPQLDWPPHLLNMDSSSCLCLLWSSTPCSKFDFPPDLSIDPELGDKYKY